MFCEELSRMNHAVILLTTLLVNILLFSTAFARTSMNALCYLPDRPQAQVQGVNLQDRFKLASVSKIVTSFWALDVLGPEYRFKTRIDVTLVGADEFDVHLSGGWDPYFGREMTHFLVSELSRMGIRKIRTLSFDEDFKVFWSVRERPSRNIEPSADDTALILRRKLKFIGSEYNSTRMKARKLGINMVQSPYLNISRIQFVKKTDHKYTDNTQHFLMRSAPLHSYVKEMNRNSNNYVADHLFDFLGGTEAFSQFIKKRLNLSSADIQFVNGSGDKVFAKDESDRSVKTYNEASCEALIEIISATRGVLQKYKYDLMDIMAVSGVDPRTTLGDRYAGSQTAGAVVAKTGSVDPAITLAGMINTEQGPVYFGILYRTNGPSDWNNARNKIRRDVIQLMGKFGGKDTIDKYNTSTFLPFDIDSKFLADTDIKTIQGSYAAP